MILICVQEFLKQCIYVHELNRQINITFLCKKHVLNHFFQVISIDQCMILLRTFTNMISKHVNNIYIYFMAGAFFYNYMILYIFPMHAHVYSLFLPHMCDISHFHVVSLPLFLFPFVFNELGASLSGSLQKSNIRQKKQRGSI